MATIIRTMRPADVEAATVAILASDWGDRRSWFEFAIAHPTCHPFVATHDDRIVGTGVAVRSGRAGWIGAIWVAPDERRRGIGTAVTEATVSALVDGGVRTLLLVSTEAGRSVYERLGFRIQAWYDVFDAPGTADPPPPAVRPFRRSDLAEVAALDAAATGEDRASVLRRFASPSSARVAVDESDAVTGFLVRAPWGGGALVAPKPDDAMRLLAARRAAAGPERRVRAGILRENAAGRTRLEADGWSLAWSAPRLVRGEPLVWRPEWVWGQFNFAMG